MTRRDRIRALAWSLPDLDPSVNGSGPKADRGEAPGAWMLCPSCDGEREIADRFGRRTPCGECGAAGRYRIDTVTLQRVQSVDSNAPPPTRSVTCDRCGGKGVRSRSSSERLAGITGWPSCEPCDGTGKVSVPRSASSDPVLSDSPAAKRRAAGSYAELELAVDMLAPMELLALVTVIVKDLEPTGPRMAADLVTAEDVLHNLMPDPVRVPADVLVAYVARPLRRGMVETARVQRVYRGSNRRTLVRELLGEGQTRAQVALRIGVSVSTVSRILA